MTRYLPKKYLLITDKVIARNVFFGHHIWVSKIYDEDKEIREIASNTIKSIDRRPRAKRVFKVPDLNFQATKYYEIISIGLIHF